MSKQYYVYIITNKTRTTLYIGITNNIRRRMYEHKNGILEGFSKKYKLHHLVYYQESDGILDAICFEKRLKKWNRKWKENLIVENNPEWKDLSLEWL